MELVGIADLAPTLSIRALRERGMPYDLYLVEGADKSKFAADTYQK
jgi:glyceraldehyde-3-phosphate dehydrogenase (NAD(P))